MKHLQIVKETTPGMRRFLKKCHHRQLRHQPIEEVPVRRFRYVADDCQDWVPRTLMLHNYSVTQP